MAGKSITLKTLRAGEDAQVPPRLGLRILAVFTLIQLLLIAALLLLFLRPPVPLLSVARSRFRRRTVTPGSAAAEAAASCVGAARRDPDGAAVAALIRKVTVNTMAAGEKLFVDLLPEDWTGLPPSLPQEVIEELARRARDAEKRRASRSPKQRALPPVRVRVGMQPTFTRYTFALPELINVSTKRADDQMAFTFEAPIKFDLADVQAVLPPTVAGIEAQSGHDNITLRFEFVGKVDVRTFREDSNYFVDVVPMGARGEAVEAAKSDASAPAPAAAEKAQPQKPGEPKRSEATKVENALAEKPAEISPSPAASAVRAAPAAARPSDPPATIPRERRNR